VLARIVLLVLLDLLDLAAQRPAMSSIDDRYRLGTGLVDMDSGAVTVFKVRTPDLHHLRGNS